MNERFAKTKLFVGILTLIGVFGYTAVSLWQTSLIRQNNIVSQRAFVFPAGFAQLDIGKMDTGDNGLKVGFFLKNTGATATLNLRFYVKCAVEKNMDEPFGLLYDKKFSEIKQIIPPHDQVPTFCAFSEEDVQKISVGKLFGYLLGEIIYFDRLDISTEHRTQFSLSFTPTDYVKRDPPVNGHPFDVGGSLMHPIGKHNCADEECPKD